MSNTLVLCFNDSKNAFDGDHPAPSAKSQPDYRNGISAHHNEMLMSMWIDEMDNKMKLLGRSQ